MRVEAEPAYILHQRPYRETSLLLDVFTCNYGRIGLVARGAKRPKSGQAVLLQPFRPLILFYSRRGELGNLQHVETAATNFPITGVSMLAGFYINELVIRLLHREDPHTELFAAYEKVLTDLETRQQEALRYFEMDLLEAIGFGPVLDHDVISGEPLIANGLYQYVSERGPSAEKYVPGEHVNIHGRTLLELANRSLGSATSLKEAKYLLRQEIGWHLGGRPLASRELYQAYLHNRGN